MKTEEKRRKNGDGNWGIREINGSKYVYLRKKYPHLVSPKIFYGKTETEVRKKCKAFEREMQDYQKITQNSLSKQCFSDGIMYWLKEIKPYDGSDTRKVTLDAYEEIIKGRIEYTLLGNAQIKSLSKELIESYINEYCIKEKNYSRGTIKKTFSVIRQFCAYLYDERIVHMDFAERVKLPAEKILQKRQRKHNSWKRMIWKNCI